MASSGKNCQQFFGGAIWILDLCQDFVCLIVSRCRHASPFLMWFHQMKSVLQIESCWYQIWIFYWTKSWKRWMRILLKQAKTSFFIFPEKKGSWRQSSTHFALVVAPVWIKKLYIYIFIYTTLYHHVYPSCCIIDDWIKTFVGIGIIGIRIS